MARIVVLHNTLDFQGSADAVCLATCEAPGAGHDVTLFTLPETDPTALADRFGRERFQSPIVDRVARAVETAGGL